MKPFADTTLTLDGTWEYALAESGPWQPIDLPVSWWLAGLDTTGPVWFRRRFWLSDEWSVGRTVLRFDGVDYEARVTLDGLEVGRHVGGFAPFAFDVDCNPGEHELVVRVDVPEDEYGTAFPHTKEALRGVLGHHDARPGAWGPRGQERCAGGIWATVRLTRHEKAALESLRFTTTLRGADADATVELGLHLVGDQPRWATVRVTLSDTDTNTDTDTDTDTYSLWTQTWLEPGAQRVIVSGPLAAPKLWWPWDHGEPFRYLATVSLEVDGDGDGDGEVTVLDRRRVGVREVSVDEGWRFHVNGRPLFIRGSNYIGNQWLSGLTDQQTAQDVDLAVQANLNMLRVHAHVTVPSFYDACDEAGVLVWQDLPMQWGYRDDAPTYRVARQMVGELVDLHGWRPGVAFWCAHNEAPWNEPWMAEEAGRFDPAQNQRLDHELAALFRRTDPSRAALANSGAGDGHTYPGWYWGEWTDVHELPGGAFVSEYGAQAVPVVETLRTFLPEGATADDWAYHGFQHHENAVKAGATWDMPVDELIARTQRYQAKIVQHSTETYRRKMGERVQGVLQFMLVDPWPCISWSVLDVERRPKLGYEALRRAMQPVLPSIEAESDTYGPDDAVVFGIWWINDLPRAIPNAQLSWQLLDARGVVLDESQEVVQVLADQARRVMQAGPFELEPGRYALHSNLAAPDGTSVGRNEWSFDVLPSDQADERSG